MMHRLDTGPPGRPGFRTIIALTGLIIVWGLSMPVIKLGLRDFPPLTFVALRYLAAVPCLLPILLGRALPATRDLELHLRCRCPSAAGGPGTDPASDASPASSACRSALSSRADRGAGCPGMVSRPARIAGPVAFVSQYLQPWIGVAASSARFGDPLGTWFVGGTVLVLSSTALTAYGGRRQRATA